MQCWNRRATHDHNSFAHAFVVGFRAGGSSDLFARFVADYAKKRGATVVVENKLGLAGAIAIDQVAKSRPDGTPSAWAASARSGCCRRYSPIRTSRLAMPIAAGERVYTRYGFRRLLELRAVDVVQPDVGNTGGLMETKKIAAMAEAFDMRIQPHVCAGPVLTAATLQLDATLTNRLIQEVYPYRVDAHFDIVDEAPERTIRNGRVAISNRPGIGVELSRDKVRPFLWARCGNARAESS